MKKMRQWMVEFIKKEDGPTAVEYAVMLAVVVVVCIGAITAVGLASSNTFGAAGSSLGGP
jgi:pilus assembly protein Flp/PilA